MGNLIIRCSEEPTYLEFRDYDLEKEQAAKPAEVTAAKTGKYVPPSRLGCCQTPPRAVKMLKEQRFTSNIRTAILFKRR
jgi:hypothetical protein